MRYAFAFDASACTGCKACQVACKDTNGLPAGVLWRRVYEVSGGTWERQGAAWTNTVFAYNVSVACNHCEDPECVRACPTDAYVVRDDGIVWLDGRKCVGCGYCSWVCPYGAPQYSPDLGRTTKCDFCQNLLDEGLAPACVAACPLRALEVFQVIGGTLPEEQPFPLTATSRTRPQIAVKPHPAMKNTLPKVVANYEEVRTDVRCHVPDARYQVPDARGAHRELPLVAFTLLGQAAAGAALVSLFTQALTKPLVATIGVLIALAALTSLLHLGTASNAWRTPANARSSALSREIVALGIFAAAWLLALIVPRAGHVALAICGVALVEAMARVYQIDAVPGWNTWRTRAAFATSAIVLGALVLIAVSSAAAAAIAPSPAPLLSRPLFAVLAVLAAATLIAQQVRARWRFYEAPARKTM